MCELVPPGLVFWVSSPMPTMGQHCVFHRAMRWSVCSGMHGLTPHPRSLATTHAPSFQPRATAHCTPAAAVVVVLLLGICLKPGRYSAAFGYAVDKLL